MVADGGEGGGGGGARRKAAGKLLSDDVLTSSDPIDSGIGPSFGKNRAKKGGVAITFVSFGEDGESGAKF